MTMDIAERVKQLIDSYLQQHAIELIDLIYRREQLGMVLRLLVDTKEGISLDECEALNSYLGELLDKENVVDGHFVLEVSSPGLDRPITTDRDFARSMGRLLEITTFAPVDDRKTHEGKLLGMDKDGIVIENDGVSVVIPRNLIARAGLKIEF